MDVRISWLQPALALALLGAACNQAGPALVAKDVADLSTGDRQALADHLASHAQPPVDYLVAKVRQHDLVLVGEVHEIRENCKLVADSLGPLYAQAELRWFCTEFLRRSQTEEANRIVTAAEYDEEAVVDLYRNGPWPTWGFQEYMDIIRAVWQVNHDRPAGAPPLVIQGIEGEWTQHEFWFGGLSDQQLFQRRLDREKSMIAALEQGPLAQGGKAIVHQGFAHSITTQGVRLGAELRKRHGDRTFQVMLHHALPGKAPGTPSRLTALIEEFSQGRQPWGMDIRQSPFAELTDRECQIMSLLPSKSLGDLALGYVFLAPTPKLTKVAWHPGFITDHRFKEACDIAAKLGYVKPGQCPDPACLDAVYARRYPPAQR